MTMTAANDDLGFDLEITRINRRTTAGGIWVSGTLAGHRFDALVFADHAENPEYELGQSRISKLCLHPVGDPRTVFNFDRGLDVPAADPLVERIVEFLKEGLADLALAADVGRPAARRTTARRVAWAAGSDFPTAIEAIRYAHAQRPVAITIDGRNQVVAQAEADRLAAAGVEFAYLTEVDGRVVAVPVNG
jgi:hypothetical protein